MKPAPPSSRGPATFLLLLLLTAEAAEKAPARGLHPDGPAPDKTKLYEAEYNQLHANTDDKDGLESIR